MRQISLIPVIYDHLSPGEREDCVARAHDRVWLPLLQALGGAPSLRVGLHLSGTLGDWMESERPLTLDRLAGLVARDQVEILVGSPVGAPLQALPERDATAHIQGAARWARARLGAEPRGAWLGAGGWDPGLPRLLARAGIHYCFVDRGLVETGGRDCDGRAAWYVAEREGAAVGIVPLDPRLPALIPWALPRYVGHELKARALGGERYLAMAISAEVLGLRHGTRRWCWSGDRAWVPAFLRMAQSHAAWLKFLLPRQAVDGHRPGGRAYPSTGTPQGVDALPAPMGRSWQRARRAMDEGIDPSVQRLGRFLVGPPWDAHLARRDETNQLHKRMLRASAAVQRLRRQLRQDGGRGDPARVQAYEAARAWLYAGQSGAVLHGGPGDGPNRPDLRHTAWRSLLQAEDTVRRALGEHTLIRHEVVDVDCDGVREVVVTTPTMSVLVRPSMGGGLGELSLWRVGNLANCMRRQEEAWHDGLALSSRLPTLVGPSERPPVDPAAPEDPMDLTEAEVTDLGLNDEDEDEDELIDEPSLSETIHTDNLRAVLLPEPPPLPAPSADLSEHLVQDRHQRLLFQEHFLGPGTHLESLRRDQHPQQGDFLDGHYALLSAERIDDAEVHVALSREGVVQIDDAQRLVRVQKRYVFRRDSPVIDVSYEVANRYREPVHTRFAVELNLGLDGGPAEGRFLQAGKRRSLLDQDGTWEQVGDLSLIMGDVGLRVHLRTVEPATLYFYQVRNVVRTCEGYEGCSQGTCLVLAWDLDLWGEERRHFDLFLTVEEG